MVMTADQLAIADASVLDVLMTYGHIQDQETGIMHEYDPYKIAPYLQPNILEFVGNTPRLASGHKKWLLALASRQQGKSATVALAMYIRTAYNERARAAPRAATSSEPAPVISGSSSSSAPARPTRTSLSTGFA